MGLGGFRLAPGPGPKAQAASKSGREHLETRIQRDPKSFSPSLLAGLLSPPTWELAAGSAQHGDASSQKPVASDFNYGLLWSIVATLLLWATWLSR